MNLCLRTLFGSFFLLGLVSCGGGGGSVSRDVTTEENTPNAVTVTVNLVFTDANGQTSTSLSEANPLTLTATAIDSNGDPVTDTLITFKFQPEGLAIFNNDTGTASTDSSGLAVIGLLVDENSGAGEITATLSSGEFATTTFNSQGIALLGNLPASLGLFSDSTQIGSSGSDVVNLIALVKDANNVTLDDIEVTFSANAEASLQIDAGTFALTDTNGIAKATLSTQNNKENRVIEITATTDVFSQVLEVQVVGTQININGSSSAILNTPVPLSISLVDSDGNGIANQTVSLSADNGLLSDVSPITSINGNITVNYTGDVAGLDTITAISLNAKSDFFIAVQEDDFAFVDATINNEAVEVDLNTPAELTVRWFKNGSAFANGTISVTSSRGQIADPTAVTGPNGDVNFSIESNNAGFAFITAKGVDADGNEVSAKTSVDFVATVAASIIVDGSPDSLAPNGQTSTITSVVRDPNGNLVKGKLVNFVVDDVSGGDISPNQAKTNRSGIASTIYSSNAVSSFEAVKVYATVDDTPSVSNFTSLTIGDRAFDISIGSGRLIESVEQSSYSKQFSVFVTDPNSNPVSNAFLTFSAPPVKFTDGGKFRKGTWEYNEEKGIWTPKVSVVCNNEDVNGNGILDVGEDTNNNGIFDAGEDTNNDGIFDQGEDVNKDGQLTPGNVVSIPPSSTTDDNGQVLINVLYAKQFGAWVDVDISVVAESAGSESSESQMFILSVATADTTDPSTPPPSSPYGQSFNCNDKN